MINRLANDVSSCGGIWPVDVFPFCEWSWYVTRHLRLICRRAVRYIPEWVPGAGFKRKAAIWKAQFEQCVNTPYDWAKKQAVRHEQVAASEQSDVLTFL